MEFGSSPPQPDAKDFEDLPHLQHDDDNNNNHTLALRLRSLRMDLQLTGRPEYLHAGSQSDGEQHQQAGLLQQVEEDQQGAEAAPQDCGWRHRRQVGSGSERSELISGRDSHQTSGTLPPCSSSSTRSRRRFSEPRARR